ncbi:Chloroperoxidase [Gautieria morchelliformis]|nr:Chloroperoxidase [Gautieria morchelliformis]
MLVWRIPTLRLASMSIADLRHLSSNPHLAKGQGNQPRPVDEGVHAFRPPADSDLRSVCPALNTLANHSYLPHDGKNIKFSTLSGALQAGYGISPMFADFLVLGGYILLRRSVLTPLDLHDINQHNGIEHNASVAHDDDVDGSKFAPTQVNPALLHKFIRKAYSGPSLRSSEDTSAITVEDIAHTRVAREAQSAAPPDAIHAEIARGEFAMVLNIFGRGPAKQLNPKDVEVWLKDNRFPPHWTPTHQEHLWDTVNESKKMRELMQAYRGEEPHESLSSIEKHGGDEVKGIFTAMRKSLGGLLEKVDHSRASPRVPEAEEQAKKSNL